MTQHRTETTYILTDRNATETHATLADAASSAEDWYGYMLDDGDASDELRTAVHSADFDEVETIEELRAAISELQGRIAAACGKKPFSGHGTYHVSAADQMGLALTCRAETRPVCASGDATGEACAWTGDASELNEIEYMPEQHRASHRAARNRGCFPANGSIRIWVCQDCAAALVDDDWCTEVEGPMMSLDAIAAECERAGVSARDTDIRAGVQLFSASLGRMVTVVESYGFDAVSKAQLVLVRESADALRRSDLLRLEVL